MLSGHGDHFWASLDLARAGPVVARDGIACTLSIELALAADIVVAADDVRFRQLEIGRGIVPFGGAAFGAPAQPGWGNAMRFVLTAGEFGAAGALRTGLVREVVPAGSHLQRARTGPADRPAGACRRPGHAGQRALDAATAQTRRASTSSFCCRASCTAKTPLRGCAASPSDVRAASPGPASRRPARSSVIASAKSAMSWYQTQDGRGSMPTKSRSSRSTGVCPSMPVSAVQNTISPVCGLISHRCS